MRSHIAALIGLAVGLGFSPMPRARVEFPEIIKGKSTAVDLSNPHVVSSIDKAARALITAQNEQIAALESQIKTETENSSSINRSYESAKSEINSLRTANDALEKAVALNQQTIALLQGDLTKERSARKKWRARTFKLGATLGLIVLTKIL